MALSFAVTPFMYPPDWSQDVLEHLEWRTDVLMAHDETEQRRSLRTKARRSFEYTFQAKNERASALENFLYRKQSDRVAVPVWTDRAVTTSPTILGAVVVDILTDTFAFSPGQLVCFYQSPTEFEFCRIAFMDSVSLTLDEPLLRDWPEGSLLYPAVLAMLPNEISVSRYTSSVLSCNITLTTSPDITYAYTPTDASAPMSHNGVEVIATQPNWRSTIANTYSVKYDIADGGTGAIVQMQTAPNNRDSRQYGWLLKNRNEIYEYRNFLGRIRGQTKAFYVPSWHDDFQIVTAAIDGSSVTVSGSDYYDNRYNAADTFKSVMLKLADGSVEYRRFTMSVLALFTFKYDGSHKYNGSQKYDGGATLTGGDTLITFDYPVASPVVSVQLLKVCRSMSDKITMSWKTDGIVEVTNTFITCNASEGGV